MKKIFYNGDFITLEEDSLEKTMLKENAKYKVETILIEDEFIKKVGTKEDVFKLKDEETEIIDLQGKTLIPAFLDAHSHFTGVASNLLKVNLEECTNFQEIKEKLIEFKKDNNIENGKWIIGCNYDHNNLQEKTHPRKEILDDALPNNPVLLQHKSGHMGVVNGKGLEVLQIDENTPDIPGGKIERIDGKPTGYMEENAFINYQAKVPVGSLEELLDGYKKAQEIYLENGITTIQEGMTYKEMIPLYKELINKNILKLDLVSYIGIQDRDIFLKEFKENIKRYKNNLKIGGYKIFLDGSPQGRTAWMRTPYIGDNNYFGYGTMKDEEVEEAVRIAYKDNLQILAHCNGDKAAEQYIKNIRKVQYDCQKNLESGENKNDIRPVIIHAQLLGTDQIKDLKELNIIPSFFIAHIYHWGDIHIKNFGYERAKYISPVGTALKEGIKYTFHQDSPVIPPNMFETIWCAVTRKTKAGVTLEEKEKISVLDAIKGVTINSAYQYFEEDKKGSIKEGKYADLIIVDKNPLKIDVDEIKDIKVLETIKNGKTLYKRN